MRCIANTLSNRTSTTTGPTSFSAWTGCWTILRRSFPRRFARWPADGGCFPSDAGPWREGIPLEALGAARQVFPADLRRDVDLFLHGRGGGDSRGHATRRVVDTSGSLLSFTGRARAHGAGRGRLRRARAPRSHTPVASAGAMVPVRRRLHPRHQAHGGARPAPGHRRVAAPRQRGVVPHPGGRRVFDALPGGRGDRLARLCAPPPGRALRPRARGRSARAHLGLLAPAAVLHSRGRHLWTVVLRVRNAGDRAVRRYGVALCAHQREPAAHHAAALGGEQRQGHRPVGPPGSGEPVWPERVPCPVDHGHAPVDLRWLFPDNHETSSTEAGMIGDNRLGIHEPISRRDFLNGALLAGAGLLLHGEGPPTSPADGFNGYGGIGDYRHSNGNTWDVLSAGHGMRDGAFEQRIADAIDTGEMYDLVAVGGGISGLAAAIFFQKYKSGGCLVIDDHPIFGGEAKRNEFLVDGQRLTAHQGSAIFLVPGKGGYTDRFYEMIGMDRSAFAYQTWRGPSPEMPLPHSPYETPREF